MLLTSCCAFHLGNQRAHSKSQKFKLYQFGPTSKMLDCCYSRLGLSHVASGLGELMQTHKPRLETTTLGEAKLLVEVELDALPESNFLG